MNNKRDKINSNKNERIRAPISYSKSYSRSPSNKRPKPSSSYRNARTPSPSIRNQKSSSSYRNARTPSPSNKRPKPSSSSYRNARTPSPSIRNQKSSSSYRIARTPSPSYRTSKLSPSYNNARTPIPKYKNQNQKKKVSKTHNNSDSGRSKVKIGSLIVFSLIATSFLLYSGFNFLNQTPVTNSDDIIPPLISITSPTGGSTLPSNNIEVSWTGSDDESGISHYEVQLDSGSWTNVGNLTSKVFSTISDGNHIISVRAWDKNNNDNTETVSFSIDSIPPTLNINSPSGGSRLISRTVIVSWTGSDPGSDINHYEVRLDSGTWINVGTSKTHSFSSLSLGTHSIAIRAYDNCGHTKTKTVSFSIVEVDKIAAFFWATDVYCDQSIVNGYIDILEDEGYTKFFCFEDTQNFASDFQQVADYEESEDIVFFYLFGHGNNNGQHSFTVLNPGDVTVWSNQFRDICDTLDSSRIGSLVESCHSGDWADDMSGGGYLGISTSDETHLSWMTANGGKFTNKFFNAIESGSNAIDAFSVAETYVMSSSDPKYHQYPKLCDESTYNFFGS